MEYRRNICTTTTQRIEVGRSECKKYKFVPNQLIASPHTFKTQVEVLSLSFLLCSASIKRDGFCAGNVNNTNIYSIQASSFMSKITIEIIIIITNLQPLLLLLLEQKIMLAPASLFVVNQLIQTDNHRILTKEHQQYQTTIHNQKQQHQPTS